MEYWGYSVLNSALLNLMFYVNPKPSITFLIEIPPQIAYSRKPEIAIRDLQSYRAIFHRMADAFGFCKVVNVDFSQSHKAIMKEVFG
jgi:thymidylate kinase